MNLDNLDKFLEKVPMHYGDAVQLYPWIKETDCQDYEWCNRTSLENAVWLIEQFELMLKKYRKPIVINNESDICKSCGCESWNDMGEFCMNDHCIDYCGQ